MRQFVITFAHAAREAQRDLDDPTLVGAIHQQARRRLEKIQSLCAYIREQCPDCTTEADRAYPAPYSVSIQIGQLEAALLRVSDTVTGRWGSPLWIFLESR